MSVGAHHRELCDYLRSIGAERVRVEQSSKHPRIVFVWQGTERSYTTAGSLGDTYRGQKNARTELRHMLGLVKRERRVGARRKRKRAQQEPTATPLPRAIAEPPSDWRDTLAEHPAYCGGRNGDDL